MALVSMLRTALRYWRGQSARVEDLEQIVSYMRQRRERGLPAVPWDLFEKLQRWPQRDPDWMSRAQTHRLRRTVEYVYNYVPFYHEAMDAAGIEPADICSLDDVPNLPITRREQLAEHTEAFISRYPGSVPTTISGTGGTTGRPLRVYLTTEELRSYAAGRAMRMLMSGQLGPSDILQIHQNLNGSMAGLVTSTAARLAGTLVVSPGSWGTIDDHLESIFRERSIPGKKRKVSGLITSPSHLWALTRRAQEKGFDFGDAGLEWIITGGATVSEDLKQLVLDAWGIALIESYGMNDLVTCSAIQCTASDRLHFSDLSGYAEVLDPQSQDPIEAGQPGVLTVTSFYPNRQLMPLLRYWTEDLVILSGDPVCVCGAATTQILDILGRADYMVTVGMNNYYPQTIGDPLVVFPELVQPPRFTLRTEMGGDAQYAILDVEVGAPLSDKEQQELCQRIESAIVLSRHWEVEAGSIKLVVKLYPAGSIQHPFPYKHRLS